MKYSIADFVDFFMSFTPWADQYLGPTVPPPKLGEGPITLRGCPCSEPKISVVVRRRIFGGPGARRFIGPRPFRFGCAV